ncbi:MAG: SAM-dependent methyltransferase [Pseudonocardia sp.]
MTAGGAMVDGPSWASAEIDITRPNVARVYDFYLGGSHNFESDRTFAHTVLAVFPDLPRIVQENRAFLRRAVLYLCHQGVDQFLDLGSGIPTAENVHEVVHRANAAARVVYVDHDPVAVTHSRELLRDNDRAVAIAGDLREPRRILDDAVTYGHLDLDRPLAVLLVSVLHFVGGEDDPVELIAEYMDPAAPGSYLVLSHARSDGQRGAAEAQKIYNQSRSPNPMWMRSRSEIEGLFGDLPMIEPGVVPIPRWRPDPADDDSDDADAPVVGDDYPGLAGVGRRD